MADTKISALPNKATLDGTEGAVIVDDLGGTPTTKRTTTQAFADLAGGGGTAPTRTVVTLSGASTDVSVPSGATKAKVVSTGITNSDSGASTAIALRHTSNTVDRTWTGVEYVGGVVSAFTGNGLSAVGGSGGSKFFQAEVFSMRDATKKTIATSRGSRSGELRDRSIVADAATDDSTMRFFCSAGTQTGTVQVEWGYN